MPLLSNLLLLKYFKKSCRNCNQFKTKSFLKDAEQPAKTGMGKRFFEILSKHALL